MEGWNLDIFKSKCEMILVVNDGRVGPETIDRFLFLIGLFDKFDLIVFVYGICFKRFTNFMSEFVLHLFIRLFIDLF